MLEQVLGGRYRIVRHLGGGGFGQTYLAEDWHLPGKPACVVKQLQPKISDPDALQTARRLFDREAAVLYALGTHDQIPRLFAHFEENQEFYLVQELIEGKVLSRELKRGRRLGEAAVIALLQDILSTLEFVHQQQVIHRDIKPSNLIRRKSDQKIVLIDFGSVKQIGVQSIQIPEALSDEPTAVEDSADDQEPAWMTMTIAVGSSGYMPNEQLAGKPRFSSDVYAVGIVGIRALTGFYPTELREDPRTGEILWREEVRVSSDLAEVLDTMVRYDFRQRFQSATEALVALNSLASRHSTVILPTRKAAESDRHLVWLEQGDELFQQQQYQEAVHCYDKAIAAVPDDYLLWFKRGIALENMHCHEAAIAAYDRVIQMQPDDYLVWFKRAKALEHLHRCQEALLAYDRVIEIQPDNYWAWHDRGRVLESLQRHEEAVAAYDRAVHLKPNFQLAIESRKRVLGQLKRVDRLYDLQHYDEAIASCNQAIRENPNDALAWLMRGMAMENSQHYEAAAQSYSQVVKIQPDDHLAWFKRGTVLEKLQRLKEAAISYTQVVRLQPDNCWAWHDRGRVLEVLHWYEAALASFEKALQVKPDLEEAIVARSRVLEVLKQQGQTRQPVGAKTGNRG
jgi:serine/threonine protein kinase